MFCMCARTSPRKSALQGPLAAAVNAVVAPYWLATDYIIFFFGLIFPVKERKGKGNTAHTATDRRRDCLLFSFFIIFLFMQVFMFLWCFVAS